jgi:hypothetical protein
MFVCINNSGFSTNLNCEGVMSQPYTYYLYHVPTKLKYYGEQHGKNAHPNNLWTTYFTSSKKVHDLIEKFGRESFRVEIRKLFDTAEKAFAWEQTVLRRIKAMERDDWLNQSDGHGPFYWKGSPTKKHIEKNRSSQKQHAMLSTYVNPFKGKKHSDETRKKMSESHKGKSNCWGRKYSKKTLQKMSNSHKGHPAWNKGIPRTEAEKKSHSEKMKGRKLSVETKKKMSAASKGKPKSASHKLSMKAAWKRRKEAYALQS